MHNESMDAGLPKLVLLVLVDVSVPLLRVNVYQNDCESIHEYSLVADDQFAIILSGFMVQTTKYL